MRHQNRTDAHRSVVERREERLLRLLNIGALLGGNEVFGISQRGAKSIQEECRNAFADWLESVMESVDD